MKPIVAFVFSLAISIGFSQLPENWEGHYSGELTSRNINGGQQVYHMELIVESINDSTWTWTIVYGEDSLRQERNYFLQHKDGNRYNIDEHNGIVLSNNLVDNQFVSVFEVQGNLIHAVYRFEKDLILFTLTSSSNQYETGNTDNDETLNNNEIPIVYGYETGVVQQARLKRKKKKK